MWTTFCWSHFARTDGDTENAFCMNCDKYSRWSLLALTYGLRIYGNNKVNWTTQFWFYLEGNTRKFIYQKRVMTLHENLWTGPIIFNARRNITHMMTLLCDNALVIAEWTKSSFWFWIWIGFEYFFQRRPRSVVFKSKFKQATQY